MQPKDSQSPSVFRYSNYRDFLRDFYVSEKATRFGFSFRAFSKRAKVSSPNHMQRVIDGSRNLSPELALRFAAAARLTGESAEYFVLLVEYNQTRDPSDKLKVFRKMSKLRRFQETQHLGEKYGAYFSAWYLPAIRELVRRPDFQESPKWIAQTLNPSIETSEARSGLKLLLHLGLLTRDAEGKLVQSKPLVSTGDEVTQFQMSDFHKEMMQLAGESIERVPRDQRDLSVLTLGLGPTGLIELKKKLQAFRKEILEIESVEEDVSQVVQLNFQLFPLSNTVTDNDES